MLNELWVEEGESGELVLVEVHHEELVGGGELGALAGELPVEVGDILAVALGRGCTTGPGIFYSTSVS